MKNKFFRQRSFYAVFLSVTLSVLLVAGAAGAVTTISTNINTGGTLTVSSATKLNGNVNVGDATSGDNDRVYLYGTTTVIGTQALVFGSSSAASLSGQAAGSVYYDSASRVLRLYDGINWYPVASSTDAGGSLIITGANVVRFNNFNVGAMALGTSTADVYYGTDPGGRAVLTLQATTTGSVPLRIFTASSTQTGNLFEIYANGAEVFAIDGYTGNASSTGSWTIGNYSTGISVLSVGGMATTTGATGNITTQGTLTVVGAITANGAVTLGNAIGDAIVITGSASTTNSFSVGASNAAGAAGSFSVSGMASTTGANGNMATRGLLWIGTSTDTTMGPLTGAGATTTLSVYSAGTTTLTLGTSDRNRGSCIEMRTADGAATYRVFLNAAGALTTAVGGCDKKE